MNFNVTRWHPFSDTPQASKDVADFDVALTEAGTLRKMEKPVDDERVTIFFLDSGRWLEWRYEGTQWNFNEGEGL
jgi:hypothetical protein